MSTSLKSIIVYYSELNSLMGKQALFRWDIGLITAALDTILETGQFYERDRKLAAMADKV